MRMDRRAGLLSPGLPSLYELFSASAIVANAGRGRASSTGSATITISGGTADPVWVVSCTGRGIAFAKVKDDTVTYIKQVAMATNPSSTVITAAASGANTTITSGSAYGVNILAIRFPGFSESVIDAVLNKMSVEFLVGRNSSSNGKLTVEAAEFETTRNHLYSQMVARDTGATYFSMSSGDNLLTAVLTTGAIVYLYYQESTAKYGLSYDGNSSSNMLAGCICHLY